MSISRRPRQPIVVALVNDFELVGQELVSGDPVEAVDCLRGELNEPAFLERDRSPGAKHNHVALTNRNSYGVTGVIGPGDLQRPGPGESLGRPATPRFSDQRFVARRNLDDPGPSSPPTRATDQREAVVGVLEDENVVRIGRTGRGIPRAFPTWMSRGNIQRWRKCHVGILGSGCEIDMARSSGLEDSTLGVTGSPRTSVAGPVTSGPSSGAARWPTLADVYEGDLADGIAVVPMTAAAGVAFGFDWLLMVAVVVVLATVIVYRRRGPRRDRP